MQNSCMVTPKFTAWPHIDCFNEFQAPLHAHPPARFAHTSCNLVCSILHLQYEILRTAIAECCKAIWQWDFGLVRFLAQYSSLYSHLAMLALFAERKEARVKLRHESIQYCWSVNFGSRVGAYMGIVELFKHFLHVRAHPRFFGLELRAPMSACTEHYTPRCNLKDPRK